MNELLNNANIAWPIITSIVMLSAWLGGVWVKVTSHQRAIDKLFRQHDATQERFMEMMKEIQRGGIAIHECPLSRDRDRGA